MKCFYHSADLDGHCSGAIVKYGNPECEMIGINYGDEFPWDRIKKYETVFMVDFSLQPFTDMIKLNKICNLYWIDHHISAIKESEKYNFIASGDKIIENGSAACELTWEYIFGNTWYMPISVYLLGRYDVWDHTDARTLKFQYGMREFKNTLPDNEEFWKRLFEGDGFCSDIIKNGEIILNYEESVNKKYCQSYSFETEIDGKTAICVNKGIPNSKIFETVYDSIKHHLMIAFCRYPDLWAVSLYTDREDVDCSEIAKKFGGGGHKQAAGFQCENLPFNI